jgi:hypothetical protein
MEHSALLRHEYRFETEKLLDPANQVDPFFIVNNAIEKIVVFQEVPVI